MVLRMLRVALPPTGRGGRRRGRPRRPGARAAAGRRRLPGLPPRGAGAARTRCPSRASCSTSAPTPTPSPPRSTARSTCCSAPTPQPRSSEPILRLSRLGADLEFRARADEGDGGGPRAGSASRSSASSRSSTATSPSATSPGAMRAARRSGGAARELRDPLPHRVPLRRAGDRQPQRAARAAGDDLDAALRRVPRARRPRGADPAATPTTSAPRSSSSGSPRPTTT